VYFIRVTNSSTRVSQSFTGGLCPPPLPVTTLMILVMIEIQYSSTALLLPLVNPCILHWNNRTACPTYLFIVWKKDTSLPAMFNPLQINNCLKRTFAPLWKLWKISITNGSHHVPTQNLRFSWWAKMNGTQRRTLVSPWRMHCMYSGMAKDTSQAEATSNSKKIKPIALAIVELCKSEGIREAGRQLVS